MWFVVAGAFCCSGFCCFFCCYCCFCRCCLANIILYRFYYDCCSLLVVFCFLLLDWYCHAVCFSFGIGSMCIQLLRTSSFVVRLQCWVVVKFKLWFWLDRFQRRALWFQFQFHFRFRVGAGLRGLQVLAVVLGGRVMRIALVEARISGRTVHHMRLAVHHVAHGVVAISGGTWMRCIDCWWVAKWKTADSADERKKRKNAHN